MYSWNYDEWNLESNLLEPEVNKQPDTNASTDIAPWTTQQTFFGTLITLIPWIGLTLFSRLNNSTTITSPLSAQADLIGAFVAIIFSALIEGAFLIAPFYYANAAYRSITPHLRLALQALAFRRFRFGSALIWVIVLMIVIIFVVNPLYSYLITVLHLNVQTNDQLLLQESKVAPLSTYALLFAAVFIAPFCEEVFFRGFVFPGLRHGMSVGWAIIISSLLFGVAHADPGSFPVLFAIGLALAFLRWRTQSIWPCITLHMLNNGIAALAIVLTMQGVIK
jgi:membrane protease YdiL (CAAX protease family)